MDYIGNRYKLDQTIKQMTNGLLLRGIDLTCKRDVLLYTFQETDDSAHQESLRWLKKASLMSDEHFMHILDTGSEDGTLFAVLQAEPGGPLSNRLTSLEITGHKALNYVQELAKGIRETQRKRLLEYSVDADNLWIHENGRLRVLNFWKEGKIGRRGVPGLALLLYQLSAKTDIPTSSIRAYSFELNRLFADLSDIARERAVTLASRAYEGMCTLAEFQQELEVLIGICERKEPHLTSDLPAYEIRKSGDSGDKKNGLSKLLRKMPQMRKWHLLTTAGFGVLILLLWLSMRPYPDHVNGSNKQTLPTPNSTALSVNRTESPKPSVSESAMPDLTAAQTAKPSESAVPPANDREEQAKAGVVPDLVGLTKEEAEKLAMASGLRYQFFLETNAAVKGVVFKQDLTPGNAINNGDRITFRVSKGQ